MDTFWWCIDCAWNLLLMVSQLMNASQNQSITCPTSDLPTLVMAKSCKLSHRTCSDFDFWFRVVFVCFFRGLRDARWDSTSGLVVETGCLLWRGARGRMYTESGQSAYLSILCFEWSFVFVFVSRRPVVIGRMRSWTWSPSLDEESRRTSCDKESWKWSIL